ARRPRCRGPAAASSRLRRASLRRRATAGKAWCLSGALSAEGSRLAMVAEPPVPLPLVLRLAHDDAADLARAPHVRAAVGLDLQADDVGHADPREARVDEVLRGAQQVALLELLA